MMTTKFSKFLLSAILLLAATIDVSALTLQEAVLGQSAPSRIGEMIPANDGETYYALSDDHSKIVKRSYKTGEDVVVVFNSSTARDCSIDYWNGFEVSEDEKTILLYTNKRLIYRHSFYADYYTYDVRHNKLTKLSEKGGEEIATLSPDARMVAFVKDNNLYVRKLDYGTVLPVTTDGKRNEIINGVRDWVYQEEFGLLNGIAWSPDNLTLSFLRWDEREVPMYGINFYEGACNPKSQYELYPGRFEYKYPVAGEHNSVVSLVSYDVENRTLKTIKLPITADDYIPRIKYAKTSDRLMVTTLNRNQNLLQIFAVNPRSTVSKLIYKEESASWIDLSNADAAQYGENSFTILSDKSGYTHLYQYSNSGALIKQITKGDWNVTDYYGYDDVLKVHYIQTTLNGPLNRVLAKVDARGNVVKISGESGTYSASFSKNFGYYVQSFSDVKTPPQYVVFNNRGKKVRTIESNAEYAEKYTAGNIPVKEFFTFQSDGYELNGYMIKPVKFDASKKYPVILSQYSGPGSQKVLNSWKMEWEQYFATQGYIIVSVDGRGTGGRGKKFESTVYMKLGKYESIDQCATADYMAKLPYVDSKHIGIWGWSYGGYETLMAMSQKGNRFAAGVAIAPVTDWRFYDTIYAERFMRTPQENSDGYYASAPINKVADVKGRLLLISGTADDNVHIANTLQYQAEMTEQNKVIDMMIYTNMNHSINYCDTRYALYLKVLDFFDTYLK